MNIGQSDAVTIGEYNEQGELMRGYYYSPQNNLANAPVAIKHNDNGITQTSYYQNDHLNTPQMLTRPNGSVVWQGQYQDDETGLHYNWYRYYDNSIGRYVTFDPIGLSGGYNTYAYAYQNPLYWTDPYGLFSTADLPALPQGLVDAAAGFGDGLSGGLTSSLRGSLGIDGGINECSDYYQNANTTGAVGSLGLGAAAAIAGANELSDSGCECNR